MADAGEVSLRPMALRPGGMAAANPFMTFGKGAGVGLVKKVQESNLLREERKKKPPGEIIQYTREFLMKFSERCMDMPEQLAHQTEVILDTNNTEEVGEQRQVLQRVAAELPDDRDWRTRTSLPPAPAADTSFGPAPGQPARPTFQPSDPPSSQGQGAASNGSWTSATGANQAAPRRDAPPPRVGSSGGVNAMAGPIKMQKAEEIGRKAWTVGASVEGNAKALKAIKGILNKLTPEKFDRLLAQLLDHVSNSDILHGTITLVFENAVAQPTFVAMYSELCDKLSKELPDFPPAEGESKPMTFKRVLLNTCQEEFEGTAEARAALKNMERDEREAAERKVKQRTLGNIRLISQLYKTEVVNEKILHYCIQDMLGDGKSEPQEDNVEAMCEMLTIAGKKMDEMGSKNKRMEGYFVILEKWSKSKALASRIRFMLRDVLDLRKSKWVPRRENLQAKKLADVHKEARAELGMLPASIMPAMQGLPPLPRGSLAAPPVEVELFPAFKGADDGWETVGKKKNTGRVDGKDVSSALLGSAYAYAPAAPPAAVAAVMGPPAAVASAPPAATAPPKPAAAAAPRAKKDLTEEDRLSQAKSLFSDFLASSDLAEAVVTAREIMTPGFAPKAVEEGIEKMFDCTKERDHALLVDLLVSLLKRNAYSKDDFLKGLRTSTDKLADLMLDVPKAPDLLGRILGHGLLEGAFGADVLPDLCEPIEGAEPRRALVAAALKYVKNKGGDAKLKSVVEEGSLKAGAFLEPDPDLDIDLPDAASWLKSVGLSVVPV